MNSFIKYSIKKPNSLKRLTNRLVPLIPRYIDITQNYSTTIAMRRSVKDSITLDETELKVRNLLVDFCNYYNSHPSCAADKKLELRITGGWVRDKLLGNDSHDLDIAINHLSGEEFASSLHDYLNEHHAELTMAAIHTIKKNPEKSKHLETCTTKLFGLDVDFVNLRSEQYTSDSRVPIIECGTAEEDALRRDATLNALFYNLNQDTIEDFTGRGMEDLKNGILRTPLQPLQTFLDDPLRVLRLIRFASKFNFVIEDETLKAMTSPEIKSTLLNKISRERVGVELEKILTSNNPEYGLRLIEYVGLTESVFSSGTLKDTIYKLNYPQTVKDFDMITTQLNDQITLSTSLTPFFRNFINSSSSYPNFKSSYQKIFSDKHLQLLFWLAVILQPYKSLSVKLHATRPQLTHIPEIFLKEGLRFGKHYYESTSVMIKEYDLSKNVLDSFFKDPNSVKRSDLGLYLRKFGSHVQLNLVFNCFIDILRSMSSSHLQISEPHPIPDDDFHTAGTHSLFSQKISDYERFMKSIIDLDLTNINNLKPVIDGKTLSQSLNMKPGPWMGKINSQILVWQLDNPDGSKDDCLEYVKQILPEYISL